MAEVVPYSLSRKNFQDFRFPFPANILTVFQPVLGMQC